MQPRVSYRLVSDPAEFAEAARALQAGYGPFAVDTERASSFRYDDRAFLVQVHRRGVGTFLIAPEGHRRRIREIFAPVMSDAEWIIHAAGEDLRSLAKLGLVPGSLFDTELASRMAGFDRPNLGAMVEHFIGVELEKGHGHEDWSASPLPSEWQDYAALDVVYLNDLAEALTEQLDAAGKLGYASQEFDHLITTHALSAPAEKTWREVKGVSAVRTPSGMQLAKELWRERDAISRRTDTSPGRVLSNKAIVDIARAQPGNPTELARAAGRQRLSAGEAKRWQQVVDKALAADESTWPHRATRPASTPPSKSVWERIAPESWEMLQFARSSVSETARELQMQPEILLAPATLRQVVWKAPITPGGGATAAWDTHATALQLRNAGARPWQVDFTAPLLADAYAHATNDAAPERAESVRRPRRKR